MSGFVAPGLLSSSFPFYPFSAPQARRILKMAGEVDAITKLYDYLLWLVPKL
jgi:hypothetical protein